MLIKLVKQTVVLCILLGISSGSSVTAMAEKKSESELPIKKMVINVDQAQQEDLFNQLRKFSEKHGFAIRIAQTTQSGKDFSIQMWREDYKILGANPFAPGEFRVGIYENSEAAKQISNTYLDGLISDFVTFINGVPNAKVAIIGDTQ